MITQSGERLLLRTVASGDETAFTELFHIWQPFLASHIYRITASKEVTEEIVQDVFLKIWITRETLDSIDNFKAYLLIVSRNHALNALRSLATASRRHETWKTEQRNIGETADPSSFYYSLIDEAINQLSPRQREVYLLHRHQHKTYHEIASQLKLSRETVKTHLQQAVKGITVFIKRNI